MAFFDMLRYLFVINILALLFYGIDKFLAYKHYYRISEKILYLFGILGGSLGALFGMLLFRHKTKKLSSI